ncbi:unnamed protein product, partial [marine sediment metagenome]
GDKALALIFGTFAATTAAQQLTFNVGAINVPEGCHVNYEALLTTTDHTYWGVTRNIVAGEALSRGEVVYQKAADSEWWLAKGDAYVTVSGVLCLVVADIADTATGIGLIVGGFRDDTVDYTAADEMWVSKATGGLIVDTQPGAAAFLRLVGHAENADTIFFNGLNTTIVEI